MLEDELIRRAREGDSAAIEQIVQHHQEAVFRLAYLMLGDAAEAEDVAQEAFIRALKALATFDATRPLRPWLLSIVSNLSKNRMRSISRYWAALRRSFVDSQSSLETENARQLDAESLWKAVQRLNPADQEIIYLRYFLELSTTETADVLKIEEGTVKSRLSRAIARLRSVVQEEFPILMEGRAYD